MDTKDLKLAYQTIENMEKMGLEIPADLLTKKEELELQYIKEVVMPALVDCAQPLMNELRTNYGIKLDYLVGKGIDTELIAVAPEAQEDDIPEEEIVEQNLPEPFYYAQIFGTKYRIIKADSPLQCENGFYEGNKVIPVSTSKEEFVLQLLDNGSIYNTPSSDMIQKPAGFDFLFSWFEINYKVVNTVPCKRDDILAILLKGNDLYWVKYCSASFLLNIKSPSEKVVPLGTKAIAFCPVPSDLVPKIYVYDSQNDWGIVVDHRNPEQNERMTRIFDDVWTVLAHAQLFNLQTATHASPSDYTKIYKTYDFRVEFADGTICMGSDAGDTMIKAIRQMLTYTTINKLASVPIKVDNIPMIVNRLHKVGKSSFRPIGNGWYVNIHMNNETKKRYLERLAEASGITIVVHLAKTVI